MKRSKPSTVESTLPKWASFHAFSLSSGIGYSRTDESTSRRDQHCLSKSNSIGGASTIPSASYNNNNNNNNNNNSNSNGGTNIPVIQQIQNEHKVQIQNEECLLRTKAYHFTCTQIVQLAFDQTMKAHTNDRIYVPLRRFMNQFQPSSLLINDIHEGSNDESYADKKRQKLDSTINDDGDVLKEQIRIQIQREGIKYDPTILPVAIVNVPPSILDRRAILNTLQTMFMSCCFEEQNDDTMENDYQPAVCILSEKGIYDGNLVDSYLKSILNQCLHQEEDQNAFIDIIKSHTSSSSTMDKIITWAQNTTKFNSVLIFIENPERIPTRAFNALISLISSMRSIHGIPVGISLFSTSQELIQKEFLSNAVDSSSLHGESGFILEEFSFVGAKVVVDGFLEQLYLNKDSSMNLPVLLDKDVINSLHYEFEYNHGSSVMFMNQLRIALAHHFATSGSFICLMKNQSFMYLYGIHSEWFCIDSKARKRMIRDIYASNGTKGSRMEQHNDIGNSCDFFDSIQALQGESFTMELVLKLINVVKRRIKSMSLHDNGEDRRRTKPVDIDAFLIGKEQFRSLLEKILEFVRSSSKKELIQLIGNFVAVTDDFLRTHKVSSSSMKCVEDFSYFFDQCIVLIDCADNDMEWDLREWIAEKLCMILSFKPFQKVDYNPLSAVFAFGNTKSMTFDNKDINVAPRHELALALSKPIVNDTIDFTVDVKIAFNAFDSRLISLEEWFSRFSDRLSHLEKEKSDTSEVVQRFAFSLYQLMFCGLVVRSRRRDNLFEKGALVWASI